MTVLTESIVAGASGHIDDHEALHLAHNLAQHYAKVSIAGTMNIPSGTYTTASWDETIFDEYDYHVLASQPTRLAVPAGAGGTFRVSALLVFPVNNTGNIRKVQILKDAGGSFITGQTTRPAGTTETTMVQCSEIVAMDAGDYVYVQAYQDSGSTLALNTNSRFSIQRIGP